MIDSTCKRATHTRIHARTYTLSLSLFLFSFPLYLGRCVLCICVCVCLSLVLFLSPLPFRLSTSLSARFVKRAAAGDQRWLLSRVPRVT